MCGIVGLFIKNKALEPKLGSMLETMLGTMCERGPDSAGFAIYGSHEDGKGKITIQSPNAEADFKGLAEAIKKSTGITVVSGLALAPCEQAWLEQKPPRRHSPRFTL